MHETQLCQHPQLIHVGSMLNHLAIGETHAMHFRPGGSLAARQRVRQTGDAALWPGDHPSQARNTSPTAVEMSILDRRSGVHANVVS